MTSPYLARMSERVRSAISPLGESSEMRKSSTIVPRRALPWWYNAGTPSHGVQPQLTRSTWNSSCHSKPASISPQMGVWSSMMNGTPRSSHMSSSPRSDVGISM